MKEATYDRGNISEGIVMAAYLKAGFTVSIPFGTGAPYDMIIDIGSRFCRIQVKTGWLRKGCIIYRAKRRMREVHPYATRPYTESEVDYFAIYYPPTGSIYVVPFKICDGDGCLRLDPVHNGQQKLIRWAKDFTWEKHVDELTHSMQGSSSTVLGNELTLMA